MPGLGISWSEAKAAAAALTYAGYPGHLATIRSPDENQFIVAQVPHAADPPGTSHWLGGYGPGGPWPPYPGWSGWYWITGET